MLTIINWSDAFCMVQSLREQWKNGVEIIFLLFCSILLFSACNNQWRSNWAQNALNNHIFHYTLKLQGEKHFSINNLLFWIFQQRVKINGSHNICLFYGMPLKTGTIYSIIFNGNWSDAKNMFDLMKNDFWCSRFQWNKLLLWQQIVNVAQTSA